MTLTDYEKNKKNYEKELKGLESYYEKICERIEHLNEQAFELENTMSWIRTKIKQMESEKNGNKTNGNK